MTIKRDSDPFYQQRLNFSHAIHTLSVGRTWKHLNAFEQRYLKNCTKFTKKEVFPTITVQHQTRIYNMYAKYIGHHPGIKKK